MTNNPEIILKALGSFERVRLIRCLSKERVVSDLLEKCSLSQSALSQHLRVLRDAGLVMCNRHGKYQVYQVKDKRLLRIAEQLLDYCTTTYESNTK